jgi:hypothetical protein
MSAQDGTQTGSLDLSRFDAESFSRHSEPSDTQAMIAEETCASHELSSAKNIANFSEPPLNPGASKGLPSS